MDEIESFIFAGGKGKRLMPLTKSTPKSLLTVNGDCLVNYSINALNKAKIKKISIVVSRLDAFEKKYPYKLLLSEGIENIFYIFIKCILKSKSKFVLFVDGDSVYDINILDHFLKTLTLDRAFYIGLSNSSLSRSMWSYKIKDDLVTDVIKVPDLPSYCHLVNTASAKSVIYQLKQNYNIEMHKYEDDFLAGYEEYYLGWGLITKLFLDYKYYIKIKFSDDYFLNINTMDDILLCERKEH